MRRFIARSATLILLTTGCYTPQQRSGEPELPRSTRPVPPSNPCAPVTRPIVCPAPSEARQRVAIEANSTTCQHFCAIDDTPHGPYRSATLATNPTFIAGEHHMGRRTGRWETRSQVADGPLLEIITYLHGPKNGPYATYHPDGSPHVTGSYHRELKDGKWVEHGVDGELISEQTFVKGARVGRQIRRHPNGMLATERLYDERGRPDGNWCSYGEDGALFECAEFVNGTGVMRDFDAAGKLTRQAEFVDGLRHGLEVAIDGSRRVETTWTAGQESGLRTTVVGDCVVAEQMLTDGRPNGPSIERSCGTVVETRTGDYCDGHFCGLWVERDETHGGITRVVEYDELSMKLAEAKFADGKLVEFWTMDDKLKLPRAACYQAMASGLCCDPAERRYTVSTDCIVAPPTTTEL